MQFNCCLLQPLPERRTSKTQSQTLELATLHLERFSGKKKLSCRYRHTTHTHFKLNDTKPCICVVCPFTHQLVPGSQMNVLQKGNDVWEDTHTYIYRSGRHVCGWGKWECEIKGWLREFDKENDFFHPFNTHINPLGWSNAKDKENYNLFQAKK